MATHEVDLLFMRGEDYSSYVLWQDEFGDSVIGDEYATATLQIANPDSTPLLVFNPVGDTTAEPIITVLGSSGYVRITCPRTVSDTIPPGIYRYDLAIDAGDENVNVFAGKQRHFVMSGKAIFASPSSEFPV